MHGDLMKLIRKNGLKDRIFLLGRREDIAVIFRLADLFLLTSLQEGTPNVLLEAQYACLPAVATRVGGVPDSMQDGVTGYMCAPDDTEGLTARCLHLLTHEKERKKMGDAGRQFILKNFSVDSMVQKTIIALGGAMDSSGSGMPDRLMPGDKGVTF